MRLAPPVALILAAALAACAGAPGPGDAMTASFALERKPHFGEAASAAFGPRRIVFTVLLDETRTAEAAYELGPGEPAPGGAFSMANRLVGDGWTMHEVLSIAKADGRYAGLCRSGEPNLVFVRLEPDGSRAVKGFVGAFALDQDNCPILRFKP